MIRFFDAVVDCMTIEGVLEKASRDEFLAYFLRNLETVSHIIAFYDESGAFLGILTYKSLTRGEGVADCVNRTTMQVTDNFWDEARGYFEKNPEDWLTVVDENGGIMGFAYEDDQCCDYIESVFNVIKISGSIPVLQTDRYCNIKMLVITDLNEMAWRAREAFLKCGYQVCVMGEKWEWFGCKSGEGYLDCAEFEKIYLYAEGNGFFREGFPLTVGQYSDARRYFSDITLLLRESVKLVYKNVSDKLKRKGVAFCECVLPLLEDVEYKTELEKSNVYNWMERVKNRSLSDEERIGLENVYGKQAVEEMEKGDTNSLLGKEKAVYAGNLIGRTLEDAPYGQMRIWVFGPCIVAGLGCLAADSLVGKLQRLVKKEGFQVVGVSIANEYYTEWGKLGKIPLRRGDVVILSILLYTFFARILLSYLSQ